jgi:hypothetical protein
MPDGNDTRPASPGGQPGEPRFTKGLVVDLVKVLQEHDYEPESAGQVVELQLHLWFFLHGDTSSRCQGGRR